MRRYLKRMITLFGLCPAELYVHGHVSPHTCASERLVQEVFVGRKFPAFLAPKQIEQRRIGLEKVTR